MNKNTLIYVAGHRGLAGSAITRELALRGYKNLILKPHGELDLRDSVATEYFFKKHKPRGVFMAAGHSGGIWEAIHNPALMALDNMEMIANVIRASFLVNVEKLIFLASSCCYPVNGAQPYREKQLGTGKTDENWSYASVKIAGVELCKAFHRQYGCNFIVVVPCNLYGPNDKYGQKAHVIPSLIGKLHESGAVELWGDGSGKREFLFSEDFARACIDLFESSTAGQETQVYNIGSGEEISILDLVGLIGEVIRPGEELKVSFNTRMPNGVSSKLMDNSKLKALGWKPKYTLKEGIKLTYNDFLCSHH